MKKTILFLSLLLSSIGVFAYDFSDVAPSGQTLYYNIISDNLHTCEVARNSGATGNIIIPENVTYSGNTYTVIRIGNSAFQNCTDLTGVTIPNTVTTIKAEAFSNCGFTSVTIPESVETIGMHAFAGNRCLTSVNFNATNCTLMDGGVSNPVFYNCTNLTTLTIGAGVTNIPDYAFYRCIALDYVTIPNSVTSIGNNAFAGCTGLQSVTIGNSVTTIGDFAFSECFGLSSVTIGRSVTSIGDYAFFYCRNLAILDVYADQVPVLGTDVFRGVSTTIPVTIWPYSESRVTEYQTAGWPFTNYMCPGYSLFYALDDESGTATVYVSQDHQNPNRVAIVHVGLLDDLHILSSVEYNERTYSVTAIGEYAFYAVDNLSSVTIPNSVTSIGPAAFQSCDRLSSITIPNSVTSIGDGAFYYCNSLSSVTIPNSVTSIENNTFGYCVGLTNVTIGESVTSIGEDAFAYCRSLTSVTIPNSVTSIGGAAFERCSGLSSVTIGESVSSIGENAFLNCSGLTSVVIPNSVETIEDYAFYNCENIESVVIGRSVNSIGENSFAETYSLKTVYNLSGTEIGIEDFGLDAKRIVTGIVAMGSGKNALYKTPESYSIVPTETNQVDNNIPESSLPTNFIGKKDGNWVAKNIVLKDSRTENNPFTCDVDFTAASVTYNRDFDDDRSSTVCLPFVITPAMRSAGNFKLHEFVSYNSSTGIATFSALSGETSSVASRPYIIEYNNAKGTFQMPTFSNVQFSATTSMSNPAPSNGFHFEGTYDQRTMSNQNDTTFYGIYYGYFVRSNGEAKVNPFRGFFYTLDIPQGAPAPSGIDFQENEGNVGIELVDPSETIRYSNDVYDLSGRCVRKNADNLRGLSQGIYIWRGKKQLVH